MSYTGINCFMKKILLVGSIIIYFEKNKGLLDRADFRILTAATGQEALRIHREERVDLIVADLNMPQIGDGTFCSMIRTEKEFRNVSILTVCRNSPEDLEQVVQSGANSWITKPVDAGQLIEKIGQLLSISIRKDYRVLVKATVKGEKDNISFFCTSYNISTSGILIETGKVLEKGDRITCTFFLPGSRQIVADGETMRALTLGEDCFHYGIRFLDLDPDTGMEIEKFVSSLTAR